MHPTTVTLTLTLSQRKNAAMREAGLNPQALAIKPGIRVEQNRKQALKRGHVKHKGRAWE